MTIYGKPIWSKFGTSSKAQKLGHKVHHVGAKGGRKRGEKEGDTLVDQSVPNLSNVMSVWKIFHSIWQNLVGRNKKNRSHE